MKKFIAAPFGNYIKQQTQFRLQVAGPLNNVKEGYFKYSELYVIRKGWVNKIGLRNPGFKKGLKKHNQNEVFNCWDK